jgi:hypothetical protein
VFVYGAVICVMGIAATLRKGQVSQRSFNFIFLWRPVFHNKRCNFSNIFTDSTEHLRAIGHCLAISSKLLGDEYLCFGAIGHCMMGAMFMWLAD